MLAEQSALIKGLKAKIVELEKRAKKNSGNSSRAPSSGGLLKPPPTSSPSENGKNKRCGQLGCVGETLKQTDTPDIFDKPNCLRLNRRQLKTLMKQDFKL